MPPKRPPKRRSGDDERSPAPSAKRGGKNKREVTYDTYDEALDGGVDFEEKGERYRDGERAQRNYERALELYQKAWGLQQTFDVAYNQARVMYTLATDFLLPPAALEMLGGSIELYRRALTLTDSPILQMDAGFNLAQSDTALADMLDDVSGEMERERIRALRMEAVNVLSQVMDGQETYLAQQAQSDEETMEEAVDAVEGGADAAAGQQEEGDADMDDEGGAEQTATFETHLPTPSALVDTALSLVEVHLTLLESTTPPVMPDDAAQGLVRNVLDRAGALCPPGRQAEVDLAEIKVLLSTDSIVWDLFKVDARVGTGIERSLEGAAAALNALLTSLDVQAPDEPTLRADIITTLANCHSSLANRMMFLSPQLPPGPNPLAQQAWFHHSQAITFLGKALDLPSAGAPRAFKPSVLLELSQSSLARARLADVNDTAKRNLPQLVENAVTYASRAGEALGVPWVRPGTAYTDVPHPAGWDMERLAREVMLQQIRVCLYVSEMDVDIATKGRLNEGMSGLFAALKRVPVERRLGRADVERWIEDIEQEESVVSERERGWWVRVISELDS